MKRQYITQIHQFLNGATHAFLVKIGLPVFLFLLISFSISAQYIDSKSRVYVAYGVNKTNGKVEYLTNIGNDPYKTTGLFAHYKKGVSINIDYTYRIKSFLGIGGHFSNSSFQKWNNPDRNKYEGSKFRNVQIGFTGQLQTPWASKGILNFLTFRGGITPNLNFSSLQLSSLQYSEFFVNNNKERMRIDRTFESDRSRRVSYGLSYFIGMDVLVHDLVGLSLKYSNNTVYVGSDYYPDKELKFKQFSFGVFCRFSKDKRFIYK